ncbi:DUF6760 family protein [Ruegeria meonggei]|uniref:DUF6760 family protein n=1 Tax=Ruegeria meonggei TaxID=1446476 RepID=UPI00366B6A8B
MRVTPAGELYEEMAFIAYHFHWSSRELMTLDHAERRTWVEEISTINRRLDANAGGSRPLEHY